MRTLRVAEVRRAASQSRLLRLSLSEPIEYEPGQSALLGLHGQPDRRHYSLATPPEIAAADGALEFLVRTERDGSIGPHLDGVKAGALVDVEGPVGRFVLPETFAEPACLFIAGGTGIAPLRAMVLRALRLSTARPLALSLAYSARTSRDFAYMKEIDDWRRRGVTVLLTATREAPESWRHDRGRLNQTRLMPLITQPETLCYVCGPPPLVEDVPPLLMKLGIEEERIRTEIF